MAHAGTEQLPASIREAVEIVRNLMPDWVQFITAKTDDVFKEETRDDSRPLLRQKRTDFEEFMGNKYPTTDAETVVFRQLRTIYHQVGAFFRDYQQRQNIRVVENCLHRFFLIFLQCGPDRAVVAIQERDDLWEGGVTQDADINYHPLITFLPDQTEFQRRTELLRDLFYGTFRSHNGDFDPRTADPDNPYVTAWEDLRHRAIDYQDNNMPLNMDFFVPLLAVTHDGFPYPTPHQRTAEKLREQQEQEQADRDAQEQEQADIDNRQRAQQQQQADRDAGQDAQQAELARLTKIQKDLAEAREKIQEELDQTIQTRDQLAAAKAACESTPLDMAMKQFFKEFQDLGLTKPEQLHDFKTFIRTKGTHATKQNPQSVPPPPPPPVPLKPILKKPSTTSPAFQNPLTTPLGGITVRTADQGPLRYALRQDPVSKSYYYAGLEEDDGTTPLEPLRPASTGIFAKGWGRVAPINQGFPTRVREQIIQPNRSLDAPIRALKAQGADPDSLLAAIVLAMSSGVAEGIGSSLKNKSGPQYRIRELSPAPSDQDCRVDSFNFNIYGDSIPEILGDRFDNVTFPSEGARVAAAHAILQRVVDDPLTPNNTKIIALQELSQIDPPKQLKSQSQMSALEAVKLANYGIPSLSASGNIIPPPVLGTMSTYNNHIIKQLYYSLGMSQDEKFTVGDPICKPLKYFLPALSTAITSNRLDEEAAYSLLMSITKGDTYFHIRQGRFVDKTPFEEMWVTLQKTSSKSASPAGLMKELEAIFKNYPTDLEGSLGRIQTIRAQMFEDHPDEDERKMFTTKSTIQDFTNLIHKYYGTQASGIETTFRNRLAELQLEHSVRAREGRLDGFREPNQINLFKEAICAHLSRPYGVTDGPSRLFGGADISLAAANPPRGKAEIHSSSMEAPSNPSNPGSNGSRGSKKNKAGYMKNANEGSQTFFKPPQSQTHQPAPAPAPAQQQQYDPGQAQGEYLNQGTTVVPQICLDNTPRNSCCLCSKAGHWSNRCRLYPNQIPIEKQCPTCNGFHPFACKGGTQQGNEHYRHQTGQPQNRQGQYSNNNNNRPNNFNRNNQGNRNGNGNGNGNGNYRGNNNRTYDQPSYRDQIAELKNKVALLEGQGQGTAPKPAAPRGILANNGFQNAPDGIYMNPATAQPQNPQ